ncbi:flagellar hook-length control protein FliK, partial [Bacillus cereus]|nr:flagellar hook-length control protein FliK [Bacillus cereus]
FETALKMLLNLLLVVESKMSGVMYQLLAEAFKFFYEGKTALAANDSAADINGELKFDTEQPNQENEVSEDDKELVL